jgi:hypothetical protein
MAKDLRLHFSVQCELREITILHNFAIEKVKNNISLQRFRNLKYLFQNCFNIVSKLFQKNSQVDLECELNHKQIGKNVYKAKKFTPSPQIFRLLLNPIVLKI